MPLALIVDDSLASAARLKQALFKRGIDSVRVSTVAEALSWVDKHLPDLVFMADLMPGKPGFAATRRLKESERTLHIPVIMYSANEDKVYVGQAIALGAEDVLVKPVSQELVDAMLERLRRKGLLFDESHPALEVALEPRPKLQGYSLLPWAFCSLLMIFGSYALFEKTQASIHERNLLGAVQHAMNFSGFYGFDELPYGLDKQEKIKGLLQRLTASGYEGEVHIVEYRGDFCMVKEQRENGGEWLTIPKQDIELSQCLRRGNAPILSYPMVDQIRSDFQNGLRDMLSSLDSNISLSFIVGDNSNLPFHYPDEASYRVSAREWNETAALNNQVQFIIKEL